MTAFTVLGASGYVGSRLVQHLSAQGEDVWAPARGEALRCGRPLGHVVYCIGMTGNFRGRPFDTVQAHVGLLAEVLQHAQFESLLYLSSTRVYLGAPSTDEEASLTVRPSDASYLYNLSKLTGESLCHASGRDRVRVARLSNVVGPGMASSSGNLVADLLHQASQGHVLLQSDLRSAKDYVHIDDVVQALRHIALQGSERVYNVASGVQTTHAQWLDWLEQVTGCSSEVQANAPLQEFPVIDVQRLRREWPQLMGRPIWDADFFHATMKRE